MTPTEIWIRDVARVSGVPFAQLAGDARNGRRPVVRMRQALMYVLVRKDRVPLVETGRRLGGMDHSTVIHGIRTFDTKMRAQDAVALRAYKIAIRCRIKLRRRAAITKATPEDRGHG